LWFPLSAPSLSFSCSSPVALTAGLVYGHILTLLKRRLDHEVDDCGDDVLGQFIGIPSPLRRQLEHVNAAPLQFKSDQSQGFVEADIFKPDGKSRLPPRRRNDWVFCRDGIEGRSDHMSGPKNGRGQRRSILKRSINDRQGFVLPARFKFSFPDVCLSQISASILNFRVKIRCFCIDSELAFISSSIPSFYTTAKASLNTRDCCSSSAYRSMRGLSLCSGMLGVRS
jgi:hypothetical protein